MNIWDLGSQLGDLSKSATVDEYINRQMPDHEMGFPGVIKAMGVGHSQEIAVAVDNEGKQGFIYYWNGRVNRDLLRLIGRADAEIVSVSLSEGGQHLSATGRSGGLWVGKSGEKGFFGWARIFQDVEWTGWTGEELLVKRKNGELRLISAEGERRWLVKGTDYTHCRGIEGKVYCQGPRGLALLDEKGSVSRWVY